jgi:hypothetical protein
MTTQTSKSIYLLDRSLKVDVYFEPEDREFNDDICISICEECPDSEKVLVADETNIYVSPAQAHQLALALMEAIADSGFSPDAKK